MRHDVIIVGSGAIAGSIAYQLACMGLQACRIGSLDRRHAASNAAGAMNGCFGEVTSGLVSSAHGRLKIHMDYLAKMRWADWAAELARASGDNSSLFTAQGTHVVLNSAGMQAIDNENYKAIERTLINYNEPYESVDPESIDWLKPNELVRPLLSMFIQGEHAVNSHQLLSMLDAAFTKEGGVILDRNVRRVLTEHNQTTGVELENGERITAPRVVVAAGVQSLDVLAELPGIEGIPPLFAGNGVSLLLKLPEGSTLPTSVIRTPNRAFACGLHCVPRGDGVLYVGATNIVKNRPQSNASVSDIQFLLECAYEQLNLDLYHAQILAVQVGNRPIPADGFPLIGECGVPGLWLATGTYRDGLHQSPLIADYVARGISGNGGINGIDLSDFTPIRPPLAGLPRECTAKDTALQMLGMGYECLWNVKPGWTDVLNKSLQRTYQEFIEALHPTFTPPPELVAFSERDKAIRERLVTYYNAWS